MSLRPVTWHLANINIKVWSDHNNPSPDSAHSDDIISVQCSQVSGCRRESSWQQVLPRVRERVVTAQQSESDQFLPLGRACVTSLQLPACVLLSCVYIIPPALHCDNCDCDIRWLDDITSEAVSDYTFTPLCCVCVGGEWGMRDSYWMGWSGVRIGWEPLCEAIKHQPAPAATGLGPAAASQALAVLWDCEVIY